MTAQATVPALLAKFGKCSNPMRALQYDHKKPGAELVYSNLAGDTPAAWALEMNATAAAAPRCTRRVDHVSLSLDPRHGKLTVDQWQAAAAAWLEEMRYQDRLVVIQRHRDEPQDHIHFTICRVDSGGSVHKDSNNFKRSHAAAARAAAAIGLKPLPPRDDPKDDPKESATDAADRAQRRSRRRAARAPILKVQALDAAAMAAVLRSAAERCTTLDELVADAQRAGVELDVVRKSGGQVQGLRARPVGGDGTWLKASELSRSRDLSWARIAKRLQENAAAREGLTSNRSDTEKPMQDEDDRQPPPKQQPDPPDPLDFLDAAPAGATPPPPHDADAQRRRAEAQDAERQIWAQLRALDERQLADLEARCRGCPQIFFPPIVSEELIHRLFRLVIRLLSLGAVDIGPSDQELARAGGKKLGEMAAAELLRRKAALGGALPAVRDRALAATAKVLSERRGYLEAQQSQATIGGNPLGLAVRWAERQHDADAQRQGRPRLADLARTAEAAADRLTQLQAAPPKGWAAVLTGQRAAHAAAVEAARRAADAAQQQLDVARRRLREEWAERIEARAMSILDAQDEVESEIKHIEGQQRALATERRALERDAKRQYQADDDDAPPRDRDRDRDRG